MSSAFPTPAGRWPAPRWATSGSASAAAWAPAAAERIGRHGAEAAALRLLNLRRAERAVAGAEPGPEGNITKLVLAEHGLARAQLMVEMAGPDAALFDGFGRMAGLVALGAR